MSADIRVGRELVISIAVQAAVYLQGLIVLPIIIPRAGERTYGSYVLLLSLLNLLFGLWHSGLSYCYRRSLVAAASLDERRQAFAPQFTSQLLALGVASAVLLAVAPSLDHHIFRDVVRPNFGLLISWLCALVLYRQLLDYFRYTFRFARFNVLAVGFPYLFVVLLVMAALASVDLSLANLLMLQIAAYVLIAMPFLPAFLREIGLPPLYTRWRVLIADARTGFPLTLELGLDFLLSFSDRYFIAHFLGAANVGRYQPAYQLGSLVTFFPKVADGVMLPVLTGMIESGQRPEAERLVAAFLHVFLLLALPFTAGASMLGPTIVAVLTTPEIANAGRWVVALVAPASAFYGVAMLAVQVAYVLGRTRTVVGTKLVGAAMIVILNLVLLPWLPTITVPAAAALVASVASCVYAVAALRSQWRMRIEPGAMCRIAASTAVMTALLWLLGYRPAAVAVVGVASVALAIGLALLLYFATLAALGGFGTLEMLRLSRIVAMLRPKGPAGSG